MNSSCCTLTLCDPLTLRDPSGSSEPVTPRSDGAGAMPEVEDKSQLVLEVQLCVRVCVRLVGERIDHLTAHVTISI